MAGNIRLEVVTPQKEVVSEDVQIVVAPGVEGEFGVLTGHTPFMTALNVGPVRYTHVQGQERSVFVSGGFAQALPDKVTVLAEAAERRREIDIERAKAAFERAQKRLNEKAAGVDYLRAKMAMIRALRRIQMAESRHR